jgi:hypothetical protein
VVVKLFQLKVSNRWSDGSFKDLITLLKDMLPQVNQSLRLFMTLRNALFVDSTNSIIEKTAVVMRNGIEEKWA